MASALTLERSHPLHRVLLCGLVGGVLAFQAASASAATTVVSCSPSSGEIPTLKVSPAALPPPDVAKYGFKLSTRVDGCTANTQQLADWIPAKRGTVDGASIVQADVSLAVAGFGNCGFGLDLPSLSPPSSAYDLVGSVKLKWLDANGDTIKSAKPSSAFLHMVPFATATSAGVLAIGEGIVTKGLGIGAHVRVTMTVALPTGLEGPWTACLIGSFAGPFPPELLPDPAPLKELPLTARPRVQVFFPDYQN